MARYLVTGGAGFIGSHLVETLVDAGEQVRVIDNLTTGALENLAGVEGRFELQVADLCETEACARAVAGIDYVLHHAAAVSVPRSLLEPRAAHDNNATATLNLLLAARDASVKRFVYAASSAVYGDQAGERIDETQPTAPMSPYAASKLAGEHYVRVFAHSQGLPGLSLRYFNVFGARQNPDSPYSAVIPKFIRAARAGQPVEVHDDGQQTRDFIHVANVARANLLAATAAVPARGEVYNIASGEVRSILELLDTLRALLGVDIAASHVPARTGDVRNSSASTARAASELGFSVEVPFDEGLRRTVASYTSASSQCAADTSAGEGLHEHPRHPKKNP